jgi:hypothetical protein
MKITALIALFMIVIGFLLAVFAYAQPSGESSPYLPELPELPDVPGLPNVPANGDETSPSTPPSEGEEPTLPPSNGEEPSGTPPAETYVTKYFLQTYELKAELMPAVVLTPPGEEPPLPPLPPSDEGTDGSSPTGNYEGRKTVTVNYPTDHYHRTYVQLTIPSDLRLIVYRNGVVAAQISGPISGVTKYLSGSSNQESTTWTFRLYGSHSGKAYLTLYVTEWPRSQLSVFGSPDYDMAMGVILMVIGFVVLFLFKR